MVTSFIMESNINIISYVKEIFRAQQSSESKCRQFIPKKELSENDYILIDMLNSCGHESVSFCVSDPAAEDMPIVFASDGFCKLTGYVCNEIEGKNCRFLQGEETRNDDVSRIRNAIKQERDVSINLVNYRKDGSKFVNEFFLCPLRDVNSNVVYFIGIQTPVPKLGRGQMPQNPGWVYSQGIHM